MIKFGAKKEKKPLTKARKIYNIVSSIVTMLVFLFLVFVIIMVIMQKSDGKDISIFGHYMFSVVSESMEPTIEKGDVILSKKVDISTLKAGDIITFIAPSGPLKGMNETHRIHRIVRNADGSIDYIKTAGDNKYGGEDVKVDSWELSPQAIKAVYVKSLPWVAGFRTFLLKPEGFVVVIVLPLALVFALIIAGFVKDRTKIEIEKLAEEAANTPITLSSLSDEEKKKLLATFTQNEKSDKELPPNNANEIVESDTKNSD